MSNLVKQLRKSSSSPYNCQGCMDTEREEAADEIERLLSLVIDAYKFIEGNVHYSQPAHDMGEEPSDQFSYEAGPLLAAITSSLGMTHDQILAYRGDQQSAEEPKSP